MNTKLASLERTACASNTDQDACKRDTCSLGAAQACYSESVLTGAANNGDICAVLRDRRSCVIRNTSACFSIQDIAVSSDFQDVISSRSSGCDINPIEIKEDIFTDFAKCLVQYSDDLSATLNSTTRIKDMCAAYQTSVACTSQVALPLLSSNFSMSTFKLVNDGMREYLKDKCTKDAVTDTLSHRRRDAKTCDLKKAMQCMKSYLKYTFTIPSMQLSARRSACRIMEANEACVNVNIEGCDKSLKEDVAAMMATDTYKTRCAPLVYKKEGCDLTMFDDSMAAMEQLTTSAHVSQEDVCRNSKSAISWVHKFTSSCNKSQSQSIMKSNRQYFGGILGNDCPDLTVRLFCGDSGSDNKSCNHEAAQTCLNNIDLSIKAEADKERFCSGLRNNVTCARNNLDGCLASEILTVSTGASAIRNETLGKSCSVDPALLDYGNVCTARPTCSLAGVRKCLEDLIAGTYSHDDCTFALAKKNCMMHQLQGCNYLQIPFAQALFTVLLPQSSQPTCVNSSILPLSTSPFQNTTLTGAQKDEVDCLTDMLTSLENSLLAVAHTPQQTLCAIFRKNVKCRSSQAYGIDLLNNFLAVNCSGVSSVKVKTCPAGQGLCGNGSCIPASQFCDGTDDCVDGSDEEECDKACKMREATYCVVKQLGLTIMAPYLPLADKKDLCSQTKQTSQCVHARTSTCSSHVKGYFEKVLNISETLLSDQGTCKKPSMCIVQQTSHCINDLAVMVAKTDHTNDTDILCKQYLDMKSCVSNFSATCGQGDLKIINNNMAEVVALIDVRCDNYTVDPPPPPPLCPDVPEADRKCDELKAFDCLISSYIKLITYNNHANNWEKSKSCHALQSVIRCVASNISGCEENRAASVIKNLNNLRNGVNDRCMLYDTSLCGDPRSCPVDSAGCVNTFKSKLSNYPEKSICKFITEARSCITQNTMDCSPRSWVVADYNLKKAISEMKTQVRCDDINADDCILSYKVQVQRILMPTASVTEFQCQAIVTTQKCIDERLSRTVMGTGFMSNVSNMLTKINEAVAMVCNDTNPSCPHQDVSISSLLEVLVYLTTSPHYSKQEFCSTVGLLLSRVSNENLDSCNLGNVLATLTVELSESFASKCETTVTCQQSKTEALNCINSLQNTSTCSELEETQLCLGEAIGRCQSLKDELMTQYNTTRGSLATSCEWFPIVTYSLSPDTTIYMTEGGPSVTLNLRSVESYPSGGVEIRIRLRLDVDASTVPSCPDGSTINQVVLSRCQVVFSNDNVDADETFELTSVTDNRVDSYQRVTATLIFEKYTQGNNGMELVATRSLTPFNIVVQDRDVKSAICSSINDPHFTTFDGRPYNYMGTGSFLMYETNRALKLQVQVKFQACGRGGYGGSCNCAVYIRVDNDVIEFDRCGTTGEYTPLSVKFVRKGNFTDAVKVMRSADNKIYRVVVATGQIIKIRSNDGFLNAWILPSASDKGITRGLCGLFDENVYNDLILPDGTLYQVMDSDMEFGTLTPNNYTRQWMVESGSENDISNGVKKDVADTVLTPVCSQCSADGSSTCGVFERTSTCGLVRAGDLDITKQILKLSLQSEPISAKRRRKRQATDQATDNEEPKLQSGWPTSTGWTEQNATEFCEDKVTKALLTQKCEQAAQIVNNTADFRQSVKNCIYDIMVTGDTKFVVETNEDLKETCIDSISKDPKFQTDTQAKEVADEIMDLSCSPPDCNDNGRCDKGVCRCHSGFVGADCYINKTNLQPPVTFGLEHYGLCEFSDTQECTHVFVSGRNFVVSELLKCHVEVVEIDETGFRQIPGRSQVLITAELVTAETVLCKLNTVKMSKYAALISVSNDGSTTRDKHPFIAYDPACQECDSVSRKCYSLEKNCDIEGHCYAPNVIASNDSCLACKPETSKKHWTRLVGVACEVKLGINAVSTGNLSLGVTVAIGVVCAVILFAILAVLVKLLCMRRSRLSQKQRDHEEFQSHSSMYANPAYQAYGDRRSVNLSSTQMEPQESFRGRHIIPRANLRGHDSFPTDKTDY